MIPHKQSYFLVEMLTTISYEYFQNKVPILADKIKEIIISAINGTYPLATFRHIMQLIKKDEETMQVYR